MYRQGSQYRAQGSCSSIPLSSVFPAACAAHGAAPTLNCGLSPGQACAERMEQPRAGFTAAVVSGDGVRQRRGISSGKDAVEPLERALLRALSEAALLFFGAGVSGTSSGCIRPTCTAVSCRSTKRKAPSTGSCPFRASRRKRNRAGHACCRVRFALWPGLLSRGVPSAPGFLFPCRAEVRSTRRFLERGRSGAVRLFYFFLRRLPIMCALSTCSSGRHSLSLRKGRKSKHCRHNTWLPCP